jgi:hypothetical protein
MSTLEISINERDVLLAILEFLENKKLHISQVRMHLLILAILAV